MLQGYVRLGCLSFLAAGSVFGAQNTEWRKPGQWEVSLRNEEDKSQQMVTVRQCTDAKSEPDMLLSMIPGQEHCAPRKAKRMKNEVSVHTRCGVHGSRVDAQLTMTGDFASAYHGRFSVRYFNPDVHSVRTAFDARWLSDCPAGMQPGDIILSNGIAVNVLRDKKMHENAPAH
jgi:hypothetical protein